MEVEEYGNGSRNEKRENLVEDESPPSVFEICKFIRETCLKVKAHPKVTITALFVFHKIYDFEQMVI